MSLTNYSVPMRRRVARGLLWASLACVGVSLAGSSSTTAGVAVSDDFRDQSVGLRSEFGLSVDTGVLDQLQRIGAVSDRFGVLMFPTEEATLVERDGRFDANYSAIADQLDAPTFAGVYQDNADQGRMVVLETEPTLDLSRTPFPEGVRVELVKFSLEDLLAEQSRINDYWVSTASDGVPLVLTALDVPANRVVAWLAGETEAEMNSFRERFDSEAVTAVSVPSSWAEDDSRTNDPNPMKGGLRIYKQSSSTFCTSGFSIRYTSSGGAIVHGYLTASHCTSNGVKWGHPNNSTNLYSTTIDVNLNNANADIAFIQGASTYPTVYKSSALPSVTVTGALPLNSVQYSSGKTHCLLGAGTAAQIDSPRCGTVFLTNVSWDFHDPNGSTYVVNGGICVNYTRSGGDSGGAVINGTATASGIHSDACSSGGVFSMIGLALQTLDQQSSGSNFQVRTS